MAIIIRQKPRFGFLHVLRAFRQKRAKRKQRQLPIPLLCPRKCNNHVTPLSDSTLGFMGRVKKKHE